MNEAGAENEAGVASWPTPVEGVPTCGVIGWPVGHSLSPQIHLAASAALGLDRAYVRLPVALGEMEAAIDRLVTDGFAGANVTMPHKEEAARLSTTSSDDVARLGAANTLTVRDGAIHADNTDAPGFADFLATEVDWNPEGKRVLLYGAGGAARACALALSRSGLHDLIVAVRDPARAATMRVCVDAGTEVHILPLQDASAVKADLVINATPVGARGESLPLPPLTTDTVVIDLLYHPESTPLLEAAATAGAVGLGGLGLLVHQAARSFEIWSGVSAPLEAMWEAARAELRP